MATLFFAEGHDNSPQGTLTLNSSSNNGAGTLQVLPGGVVSSSTFTLRFCPGASFNNCFAVASFMDPGSGATVNFTFPQKGTFSGIFDIIAGTDVSSTALEAWIVGAGATNSNPSFRSALLPSTPAHPGSGNLTVTGATAHVVLSGVLSNHTFNVAFCPGNCSQLLGSVTTDANGNLTSDVPFKFLATPGTFALTDSAGIQYQTAFQVQ